MVEQLQSHQAGIGSKRFPFIWSGKNFPSFKLFLLAIKKKKKKKWQEKCLPNWFTINIPHWHRINTLAEWISIGYCKTSDFFISLIFLVSSPPSLTTMRSPDSSSMNTSLGEFSKFPMSSISVQSSSSWTTRFFITTQSWTVALWLLRVVDHLRS